MAEDWNSTSPEPAVIATPPVPPIPYNPPCYVVDLGWWGEFQSYGVPASTLLQLLALPSLGLAKLYHPNTEPRKIELGLTVVHDVLRQYLQYADKLVSGGHISLRTSLTVG
jgi:hypothetical protein